MSLDPLETRNAHFNFNRLGALSRQFIPNFYGVTSSPLHRGLVTDRLLAEWHLDSKRVIGALNHLTPDPTDSPATIQLAAELERWKSGDLPRIAELQTRVRTEFQRWFAKGYAATAVRFTPSGANYHLSPWSDF